MKNKNIYISPEVEIINFEIDDVITTSTGYDPNGILSGDPDDNWYDTSTDVVN